MNVHAAQLATTKSPEGLRFKEMPTVREQIAGLVGKGGRVVVCPGCMKVGGITKEDLLPGVEVSSKEALFGPLDRNAAVFSY
jgi:predicted peroxiredoxin